ncbi:hypothetical protein [Nocardia sp. NPDC058705]|uniref:hypothetical protein n=1 Tax=Nocardia sp. NPDC058705 TaxID=3346609 RepID=UPI0036BA7732
MDFDLACADCAPSPSLLAACEGCVDRAKEEATTWRGTPEVRHADREVRGTWHTIAWDVVPINERCLAPLPDSWLALTADGLVDLRSGFVCTSPLTEVVDEVARRWHEPGPAVHTSADGRFAAVVTDYGNLGAIIDLRSGDVVFRLDRNHIHTAAVTPFPVVFLPGDRVMAATGVRRLDVIDLSTGTVVTERETDEDLYRGRLTLDPSGRWVVDDCWAWGPNGVPALIDVEQWLRGGGDPRGLMLSLREYAWDQPVAWVSPEVVAIARIGTDDEAMLDGVELYSVPSGRQLSAFAGPAGAMWGHGGLLYVCAAEGLEVWDPAAGARIGVVAGFRPTAHRGGTFVALREGRLDSFDVDDQLPMG